MRTKFYLMQIYADWHNCDPDFITKAYTTEAAAINALDKEYKKIKGFITHTLDLEIEWEEKEDYRFETSAADYISGWIEEKYLMG